MGWQTRSEHVDPIEQTHVVRLHDPERSSDPAHDHILQVAIGMDACPHCGRAYATQGTTADPAEIKAKTVHLLNRIGQRARAYANRHGVALRKG